MWRRTYVRTDGRTDGQTKSGKPHVGRPLLGVAKNRDAGFLLGFQCKLNCIKGPFLLEGQKTLVEGLRRNWKLAFLA